MGYAYQRSNLQKSYEHVQKHFSARDYLNERECGVKDEEHTHLHEGKLSHQGGLDLV